jgi:excisionase family DNA binding protein
MTTAKLFTPREAAQVLGVSYPTLKQWIYKKKIHTVKTAGGHHRIPEKEVDRFLYRATEGKEPSERRTNFRRISGRNQLVGRVTDIKVSGLIAQVTLSIWRPADYLHNHRRRRARNALDKWRDRRSADQVN